MVEPTYTIFWMLFWVGLMLYRRMNMRRYWYDFLQFVLMFLLVLAAFAAVFVLIKFFAR